MTSVNDFSKTAASQWITILGSTGSIGVNTLNVIARSQDQFRIFALTANTQVEKMLSQCEQFEPCYAVMQDADSAAMLRRALAKSHCKTEVLSGLADLEAVAADEQVDTVMAAIVGAAGLLPTLAAVKAGKKVLLANKESLVMAGALFINAMHDSDAVLLPIDSEHNAMFQCLPTGYQAGSPMPSVRKLLLTGSGGPFRQWSNQQIRQATPAQACNHPNWSMGQKISVDSATLMNKGLELIEACWLFDVKPQFIEVVIHPQSIIHSMVEYDDGSVLAQMGNPDMRTPIAHALAWPARFDSGVESLNLLEVARLDFEAPNREVFPCLSLAINAANEAKGMPTVLNAANEVAVAAFLKAEIGFTDIASTIEETMTCIEAWEPDSIESVLELDAQARAQAAELQHLKQIRA